MFKILKKRRKKSRHESKNRFKEKYQMQLLHGHPVKFVFLKGYEKMPLLVHSLTMLVVSYRYGI